MDSAGTGLLFLGSPSFATSEENASSSNTSTVRCESSGLFLAQRPGAAATLAGRPVRIAPAQAMREVRPREQRAALPARGRSEPSPWTSVRRVSVDDETSAHLGITCAAPHDVERRPRRTFTYGAEEFLPCSLPIRELVIRIPAPCRDQCKN